MIGFIYWFVGLQDNWKSCKQTRMWTDWDKIFSPNSTRKWSPQNGKFFNRLFDRGKISAQPTNIAR